MNDFILYVFDNYLRSFENRDGLYPASSTLTIEEKSKIVESLGTEKLKIWQIAYDSMIRYLNRNVKITISGSNHPISNIHYHEKYGWIVFSKSTPMFLGKATIENELTILAGQRSYISGNATLRGNGLLTIGCYCGVGWGLYAFIDNENHPIDYPCNLNWGQDLRLNDFGFHLTIPDLSQQKSNFISIGNDVFIGRQVNIMNGVTIGDGCVIGANSMVINDCLPYGIYAGTPAKLLRMRFSDSIIDQLLSIRWWNWTEQQVLQNGKFFKTNLNGYSGDLANIIVI